MVAAMTIIGDQRYSDQIDVFNAGIDEVRLVLNDPDLNHM